MQKLKNKISSFMYQRNGIDSLNKFIFFLYVISFIIYLFIQHLSVVVISIILLFLYLFRFFSKNLYNRQKENAIYLSCVKRIKQPFLRFFNRIRNYKTHVYKKCPNCKKILKLRKVKGSHSVKCPICNQIFNIKI